MISITIPQTNTSFSVSDSWKPSPPYQDSPDVQIFKIDHPDHHAGSFTVDQINPADALPFNKDELSIAIVHEHLVDDDSGLLELKSLQTQSGVKMTYVLSKRSMSSMGWSPTGMLYRLDVFLYGPDDQPNPVKIESMIGELGRTGSRDSVVLSQKMADGTVTMSLDSENPKQRMKGWSQDPYNPDFSKGILMNLSEDAQYDTQFPDHPLSAVRNLLGDIIASIR